MCFYRENQLLAKRNSAKIALQDKPISNEVKPQDKPIQEEIRVDDSINKKKKLFEDKAPGLFDFLTRLSQEDDSTEATSDVTSELESDDSKQGIFANNAIKITKSSEEFDLSNPVKVKPFQPLHDSFAIPQFEAPIQKTEIYNNQLFEDTQRQRILGLMSQSTLLLNSIIASQDNTTSKLQKCIEELRDFKRELTFENKSQIEKIEQLKEQKKSGNFDSNPTGTALFNHIFSAGHIYTHELVLDCELPNPIFRERNLIIKLKTVDILSREPVKTHGKVILHLSMHTWEIPSSPILRNKSGNKAIMGDTEVELRNGEGVFDRIQINEVTSKFIHGHVALVIVPSKPCNIGTSLIDPANEDGISFDRIKPLILEKVVVKSKKKNQKKKDEWMNST